jgi:Na+-translocating ferredoxin:NAD+ oxidoreductase RnfD subunit
LISGEAWVSPGQWGSEAILLFFMGSAGLMMILKVGRLDTAFSFLGSFALLKLIYVVIYLGWDWDVWLHQMMNGTLLLFTFFMITDPMTTPNHSRARILWSLLLSLMIFTASIFFYVQTAVVWMLFLLSFFTPLFDRIYQGKKYEWNMRNDIKTQAI